jgi:hypothetical protein
MQAGCRERSRGATARQIGTSDSRFPSLFDVDRKTSRAATHVDAYDEVLSDAGSTPAASTTLNLLMCNRNVRVFGSTVREVLTDGGLSAYLQQRILADAPAL